LDLWRAKEVTTLRSRGFRWHCPLFASVFQIFSDTGSHFFAALLTRRQSHWNDSHLTWDTTRSSLSTHSRGFRWHSHTVCYRNHIVQCTGSHPFSQRYSLDSFEGVARTTMGHTTARSPLPAPQPLVVPTQRVPAPAAAFLTDRPGILDSLAE
jgi:hypothetical protein